MRRVAKTINYIFKITLKIPNCILYVIKVWDGFFILVIPSPKFFPTLINDIVDLSKLSKNLNMGICEPF